MNFSDVFSSVFINSLVFSPSVIDALKYVDRFPNVELSLDI